VTIIGGVYRIRNVVNGHCYVGSAINLVRRWCNHRSRLRSGRHHSKRLQSAWNRYGEASFVFELLIRCAPEDLLFYERRAISVLGSHSAGYNCSPDVHMSQLGRHHTAAAREKMSRAAKARRLGAAQRAAISASLKEAYQDGRRAKPQSGPEQTARVRAAIATALTGRHHSADRRAKNAASHEGIKQSDSTRTKRSASVRRAWKDPVLRSQQSVRVRAIWAVRRAKSQ
jgi:group I intron endonuclease